MSASGQAIFAAALTDRSLPLPSGLKTWNGSDAGQRFAVYRNNVVVSLMGALETKYPVVRDLVGPDFFSGMARAYAMQHPPRSAIMAQYGDDFVGFIAQYVAADSLPYLADVARLECARVQAFHAADAPSLGPEALAAVAQDRLADARIRLHPSAVIVPSRFAIVSLWSAHQGALDLADVDPEMPQDALVLRPEQDVFVLSLPPGVAVALNALNTGLSLGEAVMQAADACDAFDPATLFQILLTTGAAQAIILGDAP